MKIGYFISTGLLTVLMLFSISMYVFNHEIVVEFFTALGFPPYLIYPLATAKALGLIAIWSNYSQTLKEWAYAGFVFNFLLALSAHINAGDGEWWLAAFGIVFVTASYLSYRIGGGSTVKA